MIKNSSILIGQDKALIVLFASMLFLTACSDKTVEQHTEKPIAIEQSTEELQSNTVENKKKPAIDDYLMIEWTDLIPEDDLAILSNPPEILNNIEDGSEADQINGTLDISNIKDPDQLAAYARYQQALESTKVVKKFNGKAIRLPGFIVPIDFDGHQIVKRFFFVPFFGACIHVPPPPPNQVIYVDYPEGFNLPAINDPYWLEGNIVIENTENETASSAYTMEVHNIHPYYE